MGMISSSPGRSMNVRSLVLAAALSLSTACTAHRQLRLSTVPVDVTAPLSDPRARAAVATSSIERYPGYTIAVIEFDDQGRFWDRRQVAALEAEMTKEAGLPDKSAVSTIVFVHGWRDDARVCDKADNEFGCGAWTRTRDHRINNPALYQLSYTTVSSAARGRHGR